MRYLILFFAFLSPLTLHAQDEGTVEYTMASQIKLDMETLMAYLPESIQSDSVAVAKIFEDMQNQQMTVSVLLHYSGAQALLEEVLPGQPSSLPNVSPFGNSDNDAGMITFVDFEELTRTTKFPSMGESVPYVMSEELQKLEWVLVDADSTILDHAVKKAELISDTLKAVAWYAPGIASTAGPYQFGGLPGLPLSIDTEILQDVSMKRSFSAISLKEGLEKQVAPPIGVSVTREEYAKIMMEKAGEGAQYVP